MYTPCLVGLHTIFSLELLLDYFLNEWNTMKKEDKEKLIYV